MKIRVVYTIAVLTVFAGVLLIYKVTYKVGMATNNQAHPVMNRLQNIPNPHPTPNVVTDKKTLLQAKIAASKIAPGIEPKFSIVGRSHDDPELIAHIKSQLYPPSNKPYNLADSKRKDFSQYQQTEGVKKLFQTKRNGFFIEVGGFDGETYSNSLYWEREFNWTGLLIEPDPANFKQILTKNRKAFLLQGCLCPNKFANMTLFLNGGSGGELATRRSQTGIDVPCYPLDSIIAALGVPTIDFLSLDIEGWELIILKTVPFDKVDIHVMMVEYNHIKEGFEALRQFLENKGYELKEQIILDGIFRKKGVRL